MVKTCENSNSLKKDDIDYTLENLCVSVETKLSKEYKDFDDFNKDCVSKLGKPCKHECLALVKLDAQGFSIQSVSRLIPRIRKSAIRLRLETKYGVENIPSAQQIAFDVSLPIHAI
eukprot:jgi/Bigna1/126741/aug1.3_g1449